MELISLCRICVQILDSVNVYVCVELTAFDGLEEFIMIMVMMMTG